mmetsp:Transcript_12358/g.33894  ORF Transcript_12358/g.33894 Transcript_12358/m.33894 type:complete len:308 (+) Transcript_12358:889-1812(+)
MVLLAVRLRQEAQRALHGSPRPLLQLPEHLLDFLYLRLLPGGALLYRRDVRDHRLQMARVLDVRVLHLSDAALVGLEPLRQCRLELAVPLCILLLRKESRGIQSGSELGVGGSARSQQVLTDGSLYGLDPVGEHDFETLPQLPLDLLEGLPQVGVYDLPELRVVQQSVGAAVRDRSAFLSGVNSGSQLLLDLHLQAGDLLLQPRRHAKNSAVQPIGIVPQLPLTGLPGLPLENQLGMKTLAQLLYGSLQRPDPLPLSQDLAGELGLLLVEVLQQVSHLFELRAGLLVVRQLRTAHRGHGLHRAVPVH